MLRKITTIARLVPRVRNARCMGGVPAHFKPLRQVCVENKNTMDFLPVPSGSWQEAYNVKNSQNNMILLGSLASAIITIGILFQTGCIYLHGPPPAYNKNK